MRGKDNTYEWGKEIEVMTETDEKKLERRDQMKTWGKRKIEEGWRW